MIPSKAVDFRITVPSNVTGKGFQPFFKRWTWIRPRGARVIMDFRQSEYVAPWALTLFAAYGLWLNGFLRKEVKVKTRATSGKDFMRTEMLWMNEHLQVASKLAKPPIALTSKERLEKKVNPTRSAVGRKQSRHDTTVVRKSRRRSDRR
jgi:hypothetical protein